MTTKTGTILFFGYSEIGTSCLKLLLDEGYTVAGIVTHEDDQNEGIWFETPASLARLYRIPVYTPSDPNCKAWVETFRKMEPDLILSVYYRRLLKASLLSVPALGAFNMHGSLLPAYRGRAPINWAILHGEEKIGMTLHRMIPRADAGPIIDQEAIIIESHETAGDALKKATPCAARIMRRQIDKLLAGTAIETPQDESKASYFGGRTPDDGRIIWSRPSQEINNLIRAVSRPYPGAYSLHRASKLTIWRAEVVNTPLARPGEILSESPLVIATGDGGLRIVDSEWSARQEHELKIGQVLE